MGSVRMLHSFLILSNFKVFLLVTVSNRYENLSCICPWIYLHVNNMHIVKGGALALWFCSTISTMVVTGFSMNVALSRANDSERKAVKI